ncbi:MAG: response regulator [Acidobacteria bacterium]|nr:response regulator [Acidobacteriota bacterium]
MAHFSFVFALLLVAITLDLYKPFSRSYSIGYLLPVLYASWALRGRAAFLIYGMVLVSSVVVPTQRPRGASSSIFNFNRTVGAGVGALIAGLMRGRRRYANRLARAKLELEEKVKERTAALQHLNEQYEHVIAVKGQFLSNMSHEIRTPLNGILGMADDLATTRLDEDQRAVLQDLRNSGRALRKIVDSILDLSKIEAGRLTIEQVPLSIRTVVGEVAAMIRYEAGRKGIEIVTRTPEPGFDRVLGDATRIRQILTNLAGNAIKFTEHGCVRIAVECSESPADQGVLNVRFAVEDSGIGISETGQKHLFKKFSQIDSSTTRRYEGSGLGLAICKDLVELMGGEIGVESTPGVGSTFWLRLPLRRAAALPQHPPPVARSNAGLTPSIAGMRVAIVEDNNVNRRLAERLLQRLGCTVTLAVNGKEALEILEQDRFDLVFMDCHMPEMDGFDTTRAIRKREAAGGPHTVVVAMTASIMDRDREACEAAGMDDFIAKPISFEGVRETLLRWQSGEGKAQ